MNEEKIDSLTDKIIQKLQLECTDNFCRFRQNFWELAQHYIKSILTNEEKNKEKDKSKATLSNTTGVKFHYPRLQINKAGEIVLATSKEGSLTTGILVGKLPHCQSTLRIGRCCTDWEVVGELTDYDGEIEIVLSNRIKNDKE
jgi:hypothetical protein